MVRYPSGHLESAFLLRFSLELAYGLYGGLRTREWARVCTCLLGTFHSEEEHLDILGPLSNSPKILDNNLVFIVKQDKVNYAVSEKENGVKVRQR